VKEMLCLVQLEGFEARHPGHLSGGQQQRVALARVLATRPKLVLLDEPLSALDAKLREELRLELKQILSAVGSTTIVVTHDQDEAMSLADRIIVMNRGRIEQQGSPDDIYMRPETVFVASFIGRANWFHGRILDPTSSGILSLITEAGTRLTVRDHGRAANSSLSMCVRPERIAVTAPDAAAEPGENLLPGRVAGVVNMGAALHYIVDGPDGRMIAVEANRGGPRVFAGDKVCLRFRAEDCVVLPKEAG
jgi:ABC-type Fe3+/spermidine/putrescine transport system ATPase subunit